jgi:hypothetical protein
MATLPCCTKTPFYFTMSLSNQNNYGIHWILVPIGHENNKASGVIRGRGQAVFSRDVAASFVNDLNLDENKKIDNNTKNFDIFYTIYQEK